MREETFRMDTGYYFCPRSEAVISPVIGSDLVPLKRVRPTSLTSFNKKRERRRRHLKEMLKKYVQSEDEWDGLMSAVLELAANSTDFVDKSLIELCRQVNLEVG